MRSQFAAELLKARSGRTVVILLAVAALLDALSILGTGSQGKHRLSGGMTTVPALSHDLVRLGFANLLFAILFGTILVTSEYRTGGISRAVLLSQRRSDIVGAKAFVASIVGGLFGVCGIATSLVASSLVMRHLGRSLVVDRETVLICVGIVIVSALSGPWGTFIGWILRNQLVSVVSILVWVLVAEGAVMNFLPAVGRFLPGGAQAAIYRDTSVGELFSMPVGIALFCAWLALAGTIATRLFNGRDLT